VWSASNSTQPLNPLNDNALMQAAFPLWPKGDCVSKSLDVAMAMERLLDQVHGDERPMTGSVLIASDFKSAIASYLHGPVMALLHENDGVSTVS
jgi:hypothetical protein